jgi:hypothetical protein
LLELAKRGYDISFDEYINLLLKKAYFFKKVTDINSILLSKDTIFECKINAIDTKSSEKIIKKLMQCYNDHIQKILGTFIKFGEKVDSKKVELKAIVPKAEKTRRFITVKDIISDSIPEDGTKILWGDRYISLVNDAKSKIKAKIEEVNKDLEAKPESRPLKHKKYVYEYMFENFDRYPIVLKALIDSGAQVHVARHKNMLSKVNPNTKDQHLVKLMGASGEDLNTTDMGKINGLQDNVMVAAIDDDLIISTSKLANEQL